MKRVALFLAFVALGLPLSLEAKPTQELFPKESILTKDTRMSFDIPEGNKDWSVTAGIVRLQPKNKYRLDLRRDNQGQDPSRVLGITFRHKF